MEVTRIHYNDFHELSVWDKHGCNTTILTGLKVLEDADWGPRRCTDQPKGWVPAFPCGSRKRALAAAAAASTCRAFPATSEFQSTCHTGICLNTWQASSRFPHLAYMAISAEPTQNCYWQCHRVCRFLLPVLPRWHMHSGESELVWLQTFMLQFT